MFRSHKQVILTKNLLLIAKIDSMVVSETIPLHEVERVIAISGESASSFRAPMSPSQGARRPTGYLSDDDDMDINLSPSTKNQKPLFAFQILMLEDSFSGGRSYSFQTESKKDRDEWVKFMTTTSQMALRAYKSNDPNAGQ